MSDVPFSPTDLAFREHVARIDRMIAETGKLDEETREFVAEAHKRSAEGRKPDRDHGLAPWVVTIGVVGGLLGIASFAAPAVGRLP